jgi:hypothetical protein
MVKRLWIPNSASLASRFLSYCVFFVASSVGVGKGAGAMNRRVNKQIKGFEKGDYIRVSWFDASEARGSLSEHKKPEILVDEWGIFLGVEGSPEHLLLGKHYVRNDRVWEATRIPLTLVQSVILIAKHASPTVFLRRYTIQSCCDNTVQVRNNG